MTTMKTLHATLLAAALAAWSPAAFADDADDLIRRGLSLRRHHDDAGALALFEQAHRATPSGQALAQIAMAEQALGRWAEADAHLVQSLERSGDDWVARHRTRLLEAQTAIRQHLGELEILGAPDGAAVYVAGHLVATLPRAAPVRLPLGSTQVELRAQGYQSLTRTVLVQQGAPTRESVTMAHATEAPVAASPAVEEAAEAPVAMTPSVMTPSSLPAEPSVAPSAAQPNTTATQPATTSETSAAINAVPLPTTADTRPSTSSRSTMRTLSFVSFGVGGTVLIGGIVAAVIGSDAAEIWNSNLTNYNARNLARTMQPVAQAGIVGGGLLLGLGTVLLIAAPRAPSPATRAMLRLAPGPGDVGVSWGTQF